MKICISLSTKKAQNNSGHVLSIHEHSLLSAVSVIVITDVLPFSNVFLFLYETFSPLWSGDMEIFHALAQV